MVNGVDPTTVKFIWPPNEADFQKPWVPAVGVTSTSLDTHIGIEHIKLFTKDEILAVYEEDVEPDASDGQQGS